MLSLNAQETAEMTPLGWILVVFFTGVIIFGILSVYISNKPSKKEKKAIIDRDKGITKMYLTNRAQQALFLMIINIIVLIIVGRAPLVMMLDPVDISRTGAKGIGPLTHVETDIDYCLGACVLVYQERENKGVMGTELDYAIYLVGDVDLDDGEITTDNYYILVMDGNYYTMKGIIDNTNAFIENEDEKYDRPGDFHVSGTSRLLWNPSENNKIIKSVMEILDVSEKEAKEIMGTNALVPYDEESSKTVVIVFSVTFLVCLIWFLSALPWHVLKNKKEEL